MVVVRARGDHEVGLPLADPADHLPAHGERRLQLAVVVVEHLVLGDPQPPPGLLRLGPPPLRERAAALGLVPGVAVRQRDELDRVALRGPQRGRAARVEVAVVGMGAEHDDAQRPDGVSRGSGDCDRQQREGQREEHGADSDDSPRHESLLGVAGSAAF